MSANIKPFMSIDDQIQLLKNRNLIITDEEKAKTVLSTVNYYRLINAYSIDLLEKMNQMSNVIRMEFHSIRYMTCIHLITN